MTCATGDVTVRIAATDVARLGLTSSTIRIAENSAVSVVFCARRNERGTCGTKSVTDRASFEGQFCGCELDNPQVLCTLQGVTITITEQSGRVITLRNADAIGDFAYDTAEGTQSFRFESREDTIVSRPLVAA